MNIRFCQTEDQERWIQLNREFMDYEVEAASPWGASADIPDETFGRTYQEALRNPQLVTLFMIEYEGEVIGFANLMSIYSVWAQGKALILDDLFIREEHRRKGIGKEAVEFIEEYARNNGYRRLQFQSEFTNPDAKKFYEAIGYMPIDMHFYVKYV